MPGSRPSEAVFALPATVGRADRLAARVDSAPDRELALRRRRRRVATGLMCLLGTAAFFALYALSWVIVLELS